MISPTGFNSAVKQSSHNRPPTGGRISENDYRRAREQIGDIIDMPPDPFEDDPALAAGKDPDEWIRRALLLQPWGLQSRIVADVLQYPEVRVTGCHAFGKSTIAAALVNYVTQTRRPVLVISTAPTDRQVREILWREIGRQFRRSPAALKGELLTQKLKVSDDVMAIGLTAKDADSFQGFHEALIFIIVDEASGVPDEIFDAIDGISTGDVHVLMISNPLNTSGRFYKGFAACEHHYCVSAFDTPNLTMFGITIDDIRSGAWRDKVDKKREIPGLVNAAWVARMHARYGEDSPFWITRVLGVFYEQNDESLIPLRLIIEAQARHVTLEDTDESILGVDVARFGNDASVIYRLTGKRLRRAYKAYGKDTMHLCGAIVREIKASQNCKAVRIDDTGVGGGVTDRMRELVRVLNLNVEIIAINAAEKAVNEKDYVNRRCEMYACFRDALPELDLGENCPELAEDAAAVRVLRFTSRGQIQLESKADQKKRQGRSPDDGDAAALIFAPVKSGPDYSLAGRIAKKDGHEHRLEFGGM